MTTSEITQEIQDRLYYNGELNQINLIESTSIITQVAELVLGVLSLVIIILVPIVVAIELVYISFPTIRQKTNEMILKIESRGVKTNVLGFVLRDAKEAVKRANIDLVGQKTAVRIYIGLKVKSVFMGMFILAFVIRGGSSIINFVWSLFERTINTMFY